MNKGLFTQIWQDSLPILKEKVGQIIFERWISPLVLQEDQSQQSQELILETPDIFFRDWVIKNYLSLIKEILKTKLIEGQGPIEIKIVSKSHPITQEVKTKESYSGLMDNTREEPVLNPRFTFENFIVGSCNRFVHAASMAIANSPARAYNPFFIYGRVGLGKTHLIQAICHFLRNKNNSIRLCYLTSERFTNELISAIQHHSTSGFRQKYRNMDVLVIDDIHFIGGKESTQEEFFHTFNVLYDAHKQIIISSDRPPREISKLEERLISRFSWGLIADIQPPDLETRVAILKKKMEKEPINIPDETIFFIAQLIKTNIRELEGALIRVVARSLMEDKPITLDSTKEILKDCIKQSENPITLDKILECVGEEFSISLIELKSKQRSRNLVIPRQVAMYLTRKLTDASLPEIAKFFGGRDHTTVLYAYKKISSELEKNNTLKQRIYRLIQSFNN